MRFADKILDFYSDLPTSLKVPKGVSVLYPFEDRAVQKAMASFYGQYFSDRNKRIYIFGINPGRFGAGVTGIPFTDPLILESVCGIDNEWDKKNELSSLFVYDFIDVLGGPEKFYSKFMISAVCPLGFLKEGKNYNYYDDAKLLEMLTPFIYSSIQKQCDIYCDRRVAFSLGKGTNYKIFKKMNEENGWFDRIIPLPHPRWVMQYQRRHYDTYLSHVTDALMAYMS